MGTARTTSTLARDQGGNLVEVLEVDQDSSVRKALVDGDDLLTVSVGSAHIIGIQADGPIVCRTGEGSVTVAASDAGVSLLTAGGRAVRIPQGHDTLGIRRRDTAGSDPVNVEVEFY